MGDQGVTLIAGNNSDYAPGATTVDPNTGAIYTVDANGNQIATGLTDSTTLDNLVTIPNTGQGGTGPGDGSTGASTWSLGNWASGILPAITQIANQVPATVSAIRNARTAVAAIKTPTLTQQWLQTPLEKQIIYGGAIFLLVLLAVRGKL